jgi:hypothetical protein
MTTKPYRWKGWEYETANGLHMKISKKHIFREGEDVAVCGIKPEGVTPNCNEGDGGCRKCYKWEWNIKE